MLPYALGAAAAAPIVLVVSAVIVTKAKRPIAAGLAFVAGAVALDVVFAIIILWIAEATGTDSSSGELGAVVDTMLGAIFVILGIVAVFSKPSPEKEEANRRRVEGFASSGFGSLLKLGVAVQVINSDALVVYAAGLKEIPLADPAPAASSVVIVLIVFLFIMLIPYHLPIVLRIDRAPAIAVDSGWDDGVASGSHPSHRDHRRSRSGRDLPVQRPQRPALTPTQVAASSAAYLARRASSSSFLGKRVKTIAAPKRTAIMPAMYAH